MKKKLGALCLLAMLLVIFCEGCASRLSLEDCGWTMTAVFDKDGQVVACAPGQKDLHLSLIHICTQRNSMGQSSEVKAAIHWRRGP